MTSLPVPVAPAINVEDAGARGHLPSALQDALHAALDLALSEHSDATRRAYRSDFADFSVWCSEFDLAPLPARPGTVAGYLAALVERTLKAATIARRVAAIAYAHRRAGHEDPTKLATVRAVMKGIRNTLGTRPQKKASLTADLV